MTNPAPSPATVFTGPIGTRMSDFSGEYMSFVEAHLDEDLTHVGDRILAVLRSTDQLLQGFQVSQLVHGLQTATRAEQAGADLDMVVGALCHDMGKMISNANHPAIAAEMIRPWVSDEVYWVVKVHQDFEGLHYYARVGLDPMMRRKHVGHPYYELAERFADEWDQNAFDPDFPTRPLEHYEPMVREVFARPPRRG
ncbi:MAG TPA: HD domain-containing protein [Acidimicrobiales bacterium]|jgi:predicted HD phosphohydrolase|nr:HD domain-containing protein [Acidimicrobiales bacterium]